MSPTTTSIITANALHADKLTALSVRTFVSAFGAQNTAENLELYLQNAMTEEKLYQELTDPDNIFFITVNEDTYVGYAKMRKHAAPPELVAHNPIEIERLYVHPEHQNNKIGAALIRQCVSYARTTGHDCMWLGVWEHNPRAIAFYERHGFEHFGSHLFLLGNDLQRDLWMKKMINGESLSLKG
jgi:diamine N-acetyltransferase